jgi:membrane AbrB-like protein
VTRTLLASPALRALGIGLLGGLVFSRLRTPLPWMLGPMLAVAAARLARVNASAPLRARQFGQLIIGSALGLYFTPDVAREVLAHGHVMLLAAIASLLLGYVCALLLTRAGGVNGTTAVFASVPGGAAEMAVLGERFGAAMDRVALAQSLRILLVVMIVPAALTYSGARGSDLYEPADIAFSGIGLITLLLAAGAGGWLMHRFNVPNAWLLGPLFVTITLTVTEIYLSSFPTLLSNSGQLLIGSALGSRFSPGFIRGAPRFVGAVVASILLALALSALLGLGVAWATELEIPASVLATAPGGIAEMCITAKVLQLGVPLVTAFHVTRIVVLVTATVPLFRLGRRFAE